jgi:PIN domain nuclease of toxin-antitoxin system
MADPLLLDTCACLWLMQGDRMSATSLQAIAEAQASRSGIYVSAITGWEVATPGVSGTIPTAGLATDVAQSRAEAAGDATG